MNQDLLGDHKLLDFEPALLIVCAVLFVKGCLIEMRSDSRHSIKCKEKILSLARWILPL